MILFYFLHVRMRVYVCVFICYKLKLLHSEYYVHYRTDTKITKYLKRRRCKINVNGSSRMVFPLLRGIWSVVWVSASRFLDPGSRDQGIVCCKAPRACDQTAASQSPSVFCHLWVHSCEREPVCYPWRYWLPKLKEQLAIQCMLRKLPRCLLYSPFSSLPQEAVLTSLVMH